MRVNGYFSLMLSFLCILYAGTALYSKHQGPVVQSIVSLTTSLRHQLVKYIWTTLSNMLLFFSTKNESIFVIHVFTFENLMKR